MSDNQPSEPEPTRGAIVAIVPDVFFSVTVRNTIRRLGFEASIVRSVDALDSGGMPDTVRLVIVDVTAMRSLEDWEAVADLRAADIPVLAFGPHKDVDALRQAKSSGVSRVVANSQFHREMPDLIERYVRQ